MPTARVNINPDTLAFARERAGYPVGRIAEKMRVKEAQWSQWEQGEKKPTTNQLIKLANYLDRTPGFFYLRDVPEEAEALSEFRTINNQLLFQASPKLIKAIRETKRNREILLKFYEEQGKTPSEIPTINPGNNYFQTLTRWKEILENKDMYVVQYPYVEVSESRGFVLAESRIVGTCHGMSVWIKLLI